MRRNPFKKWMNGNRCPNIPGVKKCLSAPPGLSTCYFSQAGDRCPWPLEDPKCRVGFRSYLGQELLGPAAKKGLSSYSPHFGHVCPLRRRPCNASWKRAGKIVLHVIKKIMQYCGMDSKARFWISGGKTTPTPIVKCRTDSWRREMIVEVRKRAWKVQYWDRAAWAIAGKNMGELD